MSAQDNLSPRQFYHGSQNRIEPGDTVHSMPGSMPHNYFTASEKVAEWYADNDYDPGWVHTVEPTGPHEEDPVDGSRYQAYRSRHPLRVTSVRQYGPVERA